MKNAILVLVALFSVLSSAEAKERAYQSATVLSAESRKVGEKEYGVTAHRVVERHAMVYRVQTLNTIYEIQPAGHDPLGATAIGQNIEVSIDKNDAYVRASEGKKQKEYKFRVVAAYPVDAKEH